MDPCQAPIYRPYIGQAPIYRPPGPLPGPAPLVGRFQVCSKSLIKRCYVAAINAINMHRPRRSRALQDYRELWCTDGSGPQFATHWCGKLSQHSLPDTEQATVTRLKGLFKGIFPSAWDAETFFDHQDNINHRGFCMIEQLSCTPGMPNKPICVALTTVTSQVLVVRIGAREIESSGGSPEPPGPLTWTFYDLFYMQTIRTIYYR